MKKLTLKHAAKAAMGIALLALVAGQWALFTGPLETIAQQGEVAAANGNTGEFFGIFIFNILIGIALPLVFGCISWCVMAAYLAFERTLHNQAQTAVAMLKNGEQMP